MRVLIGSFMHSTMTTSIIWADLDHFKRSGLFFDQEIIDKFQKTNTELGGFLQVLGEHQVEIIPSIAFYPTPAGKVSKHAFSYLKHELIIRIKSCEGLDGILLSFHGSMVTEDSEDGEGDLLEEIRSICGDSVYIVCTLDFHAIVTAKMAHCANVLVGYDTAPHVDMFETGKRAAEILISLIEKKLSTSRHASKKGESSQTKA
jgi:microcystin degradation protein MlrC